MSAKAKRLQDLSLLRCNVFFSFTKEERMKVLCFLFSLTGVLQRFVNKSQTNFSHGAANGELLPTIIFSPRLLGYKGCNIFITMES